MVGGFKQGKSQREALLTLRGRHSADGVALADGQGRWADEQAVAAHLAHAQLDVGRLFQAYAEAPHTAPGT